MIPYSEDAYNLFHEGVIALSEVECNGIRIDEDYLNKATAKTNRRIKRLRRYLFNSEIGKAWKKAYGKKTSLSSDQQLGKVLFEIMGFKGEAKTASGNWKADEKTLSRIDHPWIKKYLRYKKLNKAMTTNLKALRREVVDGFVHPFFNLHLTRTYRSSSDSFNFQNIPVRDESIAKLVRKAFVPRPGRQLVEIDYKAIEVVVAACYHKDPVMIDYLENDSKDMHRDMAMQCYMLDQEEVTGRIRYCGKNMFVFPQFYGDWYISCARSLWEAIDSLGLATESDVPLGRHLKEQGIRKLGNLDPTEKPRPGTFEHHIQKVENDFWNNRFKIYNQWRKDWYEAYRKKGWFKTLTGFICQGHMRRNEVINYPVQGSAFHCLLWSLIRLQKELKKRNMKSLIVGQIHDSIVADVVPEELHDFFALCKWVMVEELRKTWKWIIVPLKIEAEITPIDGSWADKEEYDISDIESGAADKDYIYVGNGEYAHKDTVQRLDDGRLMFKANKEYCITGDGQVQKV